MNKKIHRQHPGECQKESRGQGSVLHDKLLERFGRNLFLPAMLSMFAGMMSMPSS
jgi:hypothetical protein